MKKAELYVKRAMGIVVFVLIFVVLFLHADRILVRKSTEGWWNTTAKIDGFYNSPEDEYDVMFFGSSHAYASFNPLLLWEKTGVKSYVFATQQQPVWATYHYMADAFSRQDLDLAVMDVLMFSRTEEYYDDGVNYTFCDNMPLSKNKLELIKASAPEGERFNLACRFMKYHARWNELTQADFEYRRSEMADYSKGYCVLTEACDDVEAPQAEGVSEKSEITEKNLFYLNKIIDLCEEQGVELMLVKTPSNATKEQKMYYNAVEELAREQGIAFVDYNLCYDEIGLDLSRDFYDKSHLNIWGAEKFTKYFSENAEYFEGKERIDDDWAKDMEKYIEIKKQ